MSCRNRRVVCGRMNGLTLNLGRFMFKREIQILIVDDMPMVRKILRKSLEFHGYTNIYEAEDGATGWQAIEGALRAFDLVFCDWEMPVSSGLDLLKRFRAREGLGRVPFVVLTTTADKEIIMTAVKNGATGIIVKPFTNDSIYDCMRTAYKKISGEP